MQKRDVLRGLFLFLSLVDMAVIFWFSSKSGQQSGQASNTIAENLLKIFYKGFNEMDASAKEQLLEDASGMLRIAAHFGEFFLLGLFVVSFANTYDISRKKLYFFTLLFCIAYALADEIYQLFVPGRASEFIDLIIDTLGSALGLIIFNIINRLIKISRRKRAALQ